MKVAPPILISLALLFAWPGRGLAGQPEALDCGNPTTTIDINRCASLELQATEAVMQMYLDASKAHYAEDPVVVEAIDGAQDAWLAYRQAHCDAVFATWRDGTIRTLMALDCSRTLTQQRTFEIWQSFLTYADSTPPVLPQPPRPEPRG